MQSSEDKLSAEGGGQSWQQEQPGTEDKQLEEPSESLNAGLQVPGGEEDMRSFYTDLKNSGEIRLLHVQPRSSVEGVNCTVELVKLSSNPEYEALSYTWGPKNNPQSIMINGDTFEVRENL
jgi:hypothetical protein